jgi:hypothetical protein
VAKADINRFNRFGLSTSAPTHKTSTGGDPNKQSKAGGKKARAGKIHSRKRTTTRGRR